MSIAVPFQDGLVAGPPMPGGAPLYGRWPTVCAGLVSGDTLAPGGVRDAGPLLQQTDHHHVSAYGGLCSTPDETTTFWPHLHRNQQLQESLQQREEELARLQQENTKLRRFLSSSFVKNLEEKVKGFSSAHSGNLKRCLQQDFRTDPNLTSCRSHLVQNLTSCRPHPPPQHIHKRVCRNLLPEFCSDPGPAREPDLDLWVLQTLGLKDRDTIDQSASSSSFISTSSSSAGCLPDLPLSLSSSSSSGDFVLSSGPDAPPSASIRPALLAPLTQRPTPDPPGPGPGSAAGPDLPTQNPRRPPLSPVSTFTPTPCQTNTTPTPPHPLRTPAPLTLLTPPPTPRSGGRRSEAVFRGSLSPSSSFKTRSFPQGQAFSRKDPQGRWSFTWIPTQDP